MSGIFLFSVAFCGLWALFSGRAEALGAELLASGGNAVELTLVLAGAYMFWCGMMNILEKSGAADAAARLLDRLVRFLLGRDGCNPDVCRAVSLNFTANLLGLGNAATPAGLDAMRFMAKHARGELPTHGMCMFLLINTSSLQLLPTTVLSLRAAYGAQEPASILLPALLGSAASTFCAILLGLFCRKVLRT